MVTNQHYSTRDTALAAWLISQGFELLKVERDNPSSVAFLFEDNGKGLTGAVKEFQLGTPEGNILAFFRAYKNLLTMIRRGE